MSAFDLAFVFFGVFLFVVNMGLLLVNSLDGDGEGILLPGVGMMCGAATAVIPLMTVAS